MATSTSLNIEGMFNNLDGTAYGIPDEMLEIYLGKNDLIDMFPVVFNNMPVYAPEMLTQLAGTDSGAFEEGKCPTGWTKSGHRFAYTAKSFGRKSTDVTYAGLAAKQHITPITRRIRRADGSIYEIRDEWEYLLYLTLRSAQRALERLLILGDSSVDADEFDGIGRIIRTNRTDIDGVVVTEADSQIYDVGGTLTVTKLYYFAEMMESVGVDMNEVTLVGRRAIFWELARILSAGYLNPSQQREEIMQRAAVSIGGYNIPFVTTDFTPVSGSAPSYTAPLYWVPATYAGLPNIEVQYFDFSRQAATMSDNLEQYTLSPWLYQQKDFASPDCTSMNFFVWAHGRVVVNAPQALGRMDGITYSSARARADTTP